MTTRTRDMSRKEFHAALKRRGMRQVLLWIEKEGARGSIGMILHAHGKANHRASLAHAIRRFEEMEAQS